MKDIQIYRKILIFVLPRIPCYIVAFLVFILLLVVLGIPVFHAFGPDSILLTIVAIFSVVIFLLLSGFMKLPYQSAAISLIVKACNGVKISKHPYKEGMNDVKERFDVYTPFGLFISFVKYAFDKDKTKEDKNKIINDSRSLFAFIIFNCIPYIGACILTEIMYFRKKAYFRCVYETFQIIKKNSKKCIKEIIRIFVLYFIIPIFLFYIIFTVVKTVFAGNANIDSITSFATEVLDMDMSIDDLFYDALVWIFTFISYIFITPMATIKIVRFFNGLIKETEFNYEKYEKIDKKIDRFKFVKRMKEASDGKFEE